MNRKFQERIGYLGDLNPILEKVCKNYDIGSFISYEVIPMGYEDLNLIIETSHHKFFIKIFASFRDDQDCQRLIDIILASRGVGVDQPEIYPFPINNGQQFLYKTIVEEIPLRLCIMQYIDGKTFYELGSKLTPKEARKVIENAAKINSIHLKPPFMYDSWAIVNLPKEYQLKRQFLKDEEKEVIDKLVEEFCSINIRDLPHCFVHGDITKTNVMKDKNEHLYILDFSVANIYPRIQELAVLLCDFLFDIDNLDVYPKVYAMLLSEYQKFRKLESIELQTLPLFVKLAHAMHVLCATYEKVVNKNTSIENEYFLELGRTGLKYTTYNWEN